MNLLRNKPLMITIVIVIVLIFLIIATSSGNGFSQNTTVAGNAFVPVQRFFYQISSAIGGFFSGSSVDLAVENEQLQTRLDTYESNQMSYEELLAENERLSKMLDYKQNNETQELKVANIIGKEPSNWFDVFTIDLGAKDGIAENMPVITPDGLVGRIEEVGLNWSKVMGIIDGRSSVAAIMERTRDIGVVKGAIGVDELSATLLMNYLPLDTDIVEGDVVLTSGYDQLYPKGLAIGTVLTTKSDTGGKNVTIQPNVDFRRLEEVMVVVSTKEAAAVSTDDIADDTAVASPLPAESALPEETAADGAEETQE